MNKDKNYYSILNVKKDDNSNIIRKSYYKLAMLNHPDKNGDANIFSEITKAYDILMDEEKRKEYDLKSKWGRNYDETYELFDLNVDFSYKESKDQLDKFKKFNINNIQIEINNEFNGILEYERWVKCKSCDGTGKDIHSKIVIKDNDGNTKFFEPDDGCDFCNGTGKDHKDKECYFCKGHGRIGINNCKSCKGNKRILGKQKLKNIKLTGTETKIDTMGHFSKDGVIGYLLLIKK